MSQNAAGVMAKEGHNAEEILAFFYEGGRLYDIR
jgi:peptidoglycan hydrolase-like amidase